MDKTRIIADLRRLAEGNQLSAFAKASKTDRRTLQRMLAHETTKPHHATLELLATHLRKPKWAGKKEV